MLRQVAVLTSGALLLAYVATGGWVTFSQDRTARLGVDLTPMGAERSGNAAGTIPAWDGGITAPPAGYRPGDHHPDPYADDEILFTITAANLRQYADTLTPGHQAILQTYATFEMNVYPSRRSASFPQRIYDATRLTAGTAKLTDRGYGVTGAVNGIPFPIPESALEVIWNHLLRYRGDTGIRYVAQAAPTRGGQLLARPIRGRVQYRVQP